MHLPRILASVVSAVLAAALAFAEPPAGKPEETAEPRADVARIRALYEGRQFSELTALFEQYQASAEKDVRWEHAVNDAVLFFFAEQPSFRKFLDEWVAASPGRWPPVLARAVFFESVAWKARGGASAKETSDLQFRKMQETMIEAARDAEKALAINSRLAPAYAVLMGVNQSRGDRQIGALLLEKALRECPDSYIVRYAHMQHLTPRWGGSYEAMQEFALASAAAAGGRNPRIRTLQGMVYRDMAWTAMIDRNYPEAIDLYEKALAFGETTGVLLDLAKAYMRARIPEKAVEFAGRAVARDPNAARGYGILATVFLYQERWEPALEYLEQMRRTGGPGADDYDAIRKWGSGKIVQEANRLYRERSDTKAVEMYDLALRVDPENAEAYCWRGNTFRRGGNLPRAEEDLRKAIFHNPRLFEAYHGLDGLLLMGGRLDEIVGIWDRFIELEPGNANAHLERGGAYYRKGDLESAFRDAARACELGSAEGCRLADRFRGRGGAGGGR